MKFGLLAKALLASKIPFQHMFLLGAREYAISEESVHIWEFPVNFPGPAWSPINGTSGGMVPPLRVLWESSRQDEFFGPMLMFLWQSHAMEQWTPHLTEFLTKIHNLTKNCSGVVVGGCLGCNHQKSKRAETTHESHLCKYHCLVHSPSSDKRWAIREAGARIDRIWVLSGTHWAGDSSAPSSGLFLPPPPLLAVTNNDDWGSKWPSPPP